MVVVLACTTTISLNAQEIVPVWYNAGDSYFKAVTKNTEGNFTMSVMGTIDGERCDSAYEIGVFCGDECRVSVPFYSTETMFEYFKFYSRLTVNGVAGETFSFRLYDHRNNVEVEAEITPKKQDFVADEHYGSFNTKLYNLAFENSTSHRSSLDIDDATDLPFTGNQYGITADGIACSYTRNAYLDGGYETIVLPFDADIASIKEEGFVFEKFDGFGENTIKFTELEDGEVLKAGVAYLFRYSRTPSDGRKELQFTAANVQQLNDAIVEEKGWAGTFKAMDGDAIAGKYILNIKGDKMMKAGYGATLAPYHAYLTLPEGADASTMFVSHGRETTDIDNMQQQGDTEIMYDLNGRRINELPNSGIVIINQKKIYIK